MFCLPIPSLRNPVFILLFPCVLAAGVYRERMRKRYNIDVCQFGSLAHVSINGDDFDSGLMDCLKPPVSVSSGVFNCICCPVRMSVNQSATAFMEYWWALILCVILFPFIPIIGYIHRMHIRDLFNLDRHPVADFFAWLCCYCCALTQESKFINHGFDAVRRGTSAVFVGRPTPRQSFANNTNLV